MRLPKARASAKKIPLIEEVAEAIQVLSQVKSRLMKLLRDSFMS